MADSERQFHWFGSASNRDAAMELADHLSAHGYPAEARQESGWHVYWVPPDDEELLEEIGFALFRPRGLRVPLSRLLADLDDVFGERTLPDSLDAQSHPIRGKGSQHPVGESAPKIHWPEASKGQMPRWAYWIPRRNREAIVGDILEDCVDLRERGAGQWRIRFHVAWQLLWVLLSIVPRALAVCGSVLKRSFLE